MRNFVPIDRYNIVDWLIIWAHIYAFKLNRKILF